MTCCTNPRCRGGWLDVDVICPACQNDRRPDEEEVPAGRTINQWVEAVAANNRAKGFWSDGDRPAELAMLVVTEVAEYVEALRDGHNPGSWHVTERGKPDGPAAELADVLIRCFDMAARYDIDLAAVLAAKHAYNCGRPYQHGGRVLNQTRETP